MDYDPSFHQMGSGDIRDYGRAVKGVREDCGLSGKDVAERAGISASYISEIETGKRPLTDSFAERLALALGLSLEDFTRRLRSRYLPSISRASPRTNEQIASDAFSSTLQEKIIPYGFPGPDVANEFRQLASYLLKAVPKGEAWELVRTLTNQAENGDIAAAKCAKALIEILSESIEPN